MQPTSSDAETLRAIVARWRLDPVAFVREVLEVERMEPFQVAALQALSRGERVAIRSGHGVGKTALEAWAILWFASTRLPFKIPCTANTGSQLYDVLWAEVGLWLRKMRETWPLLGNRLNLSQDRMEVVTAPAESFAAARTARRENPEALQGFHSPNLLFVIEEASGIDEKVFEVAEGALSTPGALVLMAGNPTRRSGYFFRAFHADREFWHCIHVPCSASSRVSPEFLQRMAQTYGEDSDIYKVRVQGEFPSASSMQFIPFDIVEQCRSYKADWPAHHPYILGVDVARFGDDRSVLIGRQGRKVWPAIKLRGLDTMALADRVIHEAEKQKADFIVVDGVGVGGGVIDRLKQLGIRNVIEISGAMTPSDPSMYANKRAELWGWMRDALREGCELPEDSELVDDLVAVEYGYTSKQQILLERKEDMKKRGLASPDIADALSLTFAPRHRAAPLGQQFTNRPQYALTAGDDIFGD